MKKSAALHVAAGLLAATCFWSRSLSAPATAEEVDVVVNKTNGIATLSVGEARKIFVGDRSSWPRGNHIVVLMLSPGHSERVVILREIYKMSETDYAKYFLQAAFAGKIQEPPKNLSSALLMKQFLTANPRAIGYLKKSDVDSTLKVVLELR
jgi:hypothetical protein